MEPFASPPAEVGAGNRDPYPGSRAQPAASVCHRGRGGLPTDGAPSRPHPSPVAYPHGVDIDGERRLAVAVLERAARDLVGSTCSSNTKLEREWRAHACAWVTEAGAMFRHWCELAGLDWTRARRSLLGTVAPAEREKLLAAHRRALQKRCAPGGGAPSCSGSRAGRGVGSPRRGDHEAARGRCS